MIVVSVPLPAIMGNAMGTTILWRPTFPSWQLVKEWIPQYLSPQIG